MSQDPSSAPSEFSPNTYLGVYELKEQLGAGGMGMVYRAVDTKLGRTVALKVIRAELLHDDRLARFEREANYDVTADGQRFLMIKDDDQDLVASKEIVVVLNWAMELNRLVARS